MNWLAQNWGWIALTIGAIWLFRCGGLAGCGMSSHGSHTTHGSGAGSAPGGTLDGDGSIRNQGQAGGDDPRTALETQAHNATPTWQQHRHRGCC
jgi:hypothetical protein